MVFDPGGGTAVIWLISKAWQDSYFGKRSLKQKLESQDIRLGNTKTKLSKNVKNHNRLILTAVQENKKNQIQ